ncbi:addiction module protein [Alkalimonas mucilaginosa]|uniref:Addiction module protein n=1 Tax=Alkalimonas mucilaginosa TaxID=3057676 RepID=A0ABU7JDV0_9GAMM|nr:addiction module protein [Alkalimonas sp. MEB004]MEE2023660.1 addiction module protein [Alkalimonas sp. MEB004]
MSVTLEQLIEVTKELSANDRALLAHCLISSLEKTQDDDVDASWSLVAEQRLEELETGKVQGISWDEIKSKLK